MTKNRDPYYGKQTYSADTVEVHRVLCFYTGLASSQEEFEQMVREGEVEVNDTDVIEATIIRGPVEDIRTAPDDTRVHLNTLTEDEMMAVYRLARQHIADLPAVKNGLTIIQYKLNQIIEGL